MILAVDLGTTAVKAVAWSADGPRAEARTTLVSARPAPGLVEQDAEDWWTATSTVVNQVTAALGADARRIEALSFSTARDTIVAVDDGLQPLTPAIVWSDRRAPSVAGKLTWWEHEVPDVVRRARWVVGPRDLVVGRLTGLVATDVTVASRSGLYDDSGALVAGLSEEWIDRLPPIVDPQEVVGSVSDSCADELGLPAGVPVVVGAGDRACEVVGVGATSGSPMVSWGTTVNMSAPSRSRPTSAPAGLVISRAADGGWLLEGGLSGAGSLLDWLAGLTGTTTSVLAAEAAAADPGAAGVFCLPWIDGARAPWWRPDASAGFVGIDATHRRAHVARAAYEAVAADVARCLELTGKAMEEPPGALRLCGGGSTAPPWLEALSGVTGRPVVGRAHAEAASVGAALIGAAAVGTAMDLDSINPPKAEIRAAHDVVARYAEWRVRADALARLVIEGDGV